MSTTRRILAMLMLAIVATCSVSFAADEKKPTVSAEKLVFVANGLVHIHDTVVKTIPGFNASKPVYLACGEKEGTPNGVVGNDWMHDNGTTSLKSTWDSYKLASNGEYWTIPVPAAYYAVGYIRFWPVQMDGDNVIYAKAYEAFRGAPWLISTETGPAMVAGLR